MTDSPTDPEFTSAPPVAKSASVPSLRLPWPAVVLLLAASAGAVYMSYQYVSQPVNVLPPLKTHKGSESSLAPRKASTPKKAPAPAPQPDAEAPSR